MPKKLPPPETSTARHLASIARKSGKLTKRDSSYLKTYGKSVVTAVYLIRGGPRSPLGHKFDLTVKDMLIYLEEMPPMNRRR